MKERFTYVHTDETLTELSVSQMAAEVQFQVTATKCRTRDVRADQNATTEDSELVIGSGN